MPLTPEEAKELAALEAEESGLTPEEAAELAQLEQEELAAAPTPPGPSDDVGPPMNSEQETVWDRLKDPKRLQAILTGTGPHAMKVVQGSAPMAIPAGQLPAGVSKLAEFLNKGAATRIATNAGVGAVQGAVDPNSTAKSGALTQGGISAGLEAMGGLGKLLGMGMRGIGKSATGATREQAKTYADAHKQGEELFNLQKNDPDKLMQMALDETKRATRTLQEKSTAPAMQKLNERAASKSFRVKPSQFEGTAAGAEIQRAQALRPDLMVQPKSSPYSAPRPAEFPNETSITGAQLLRAKRASGDAMNANRAKNPLGYRAGDDTEAAAMDKLRTALRDTDPQAADMDAVVEKNLRLTRHAKELPNAARIYNHSETLGDVPLRQVQQHLDEMTGSQFGSKARALDAAEAVHKPSESFLQDILKPTGRALLRGSGRAEKASRALTDQQVIDRLADAVRKKDVK